MIGGQHSPTWNIEKMKQRASQQGNSNEQSRFSSQNEIIRAMKQVAASMEPNSKNIINFPTNAFIVTYNESNNTFSESIGASQLFVLIYPNGSVLMYLKK